MKHRNSAGDTIVEVFIAMAVASAVLAGAFTIVNKSLSNVRQSQEHGEALKLAESQLEQIKAALAKNPTAIDGGRAYCMGSTGNLVKFGPPDITALPADLSAYPSACKGIGSVSYRVGFIADGNKTFKVHVNWDGATGIKDSVGLSYRVYK